LKFGKPGFNFSELVSFLIFRKGNQGDDGWDNHHWKQEVELNEQRSGEMMQRVTSASSVSEEHLNCMFIGLKKKSLYLKTFH